MFAKAVFLVSLAASALGNVYITSPTGNSTFTGGQQATIQWQDDGASPSLAQFGPAVISIYVGNAIQQTQLQQIANVDVSKNSSVQFTPNPSIGPDSSDYFIRIDSVSLKDSKQPQYPAMAFSAKFKLTSMSGTFNATEQAQINGQSTAPLAAPTGTPSLNSTASTAATTTGTATHTGASSTATHNGATGLKTGSFGLLLAAVVGATLF